MFINLLIFFKVTHWRKMRYVGLATSQQPDSTNSWLKPWCLSTYFLIFRTEYRLKWVVHTILFSNVRIKAACRSHYTDVIMTTMASQITSLTVVYSTYYSDADQRKHQSSASLAFVWGIHRDRWIPRTKGQLRGKCFHLMTSSWKTHNHQPERCV